MLLCWQNAAGCALVLVVVSSLGLGEEVGHSPAPLEVAEPE